MKPSPVIHPQDLAYTFASLLRAELGDQIEDVIALNQNEPNGNVCHSHDFIDANEVMAEAFASVVGRPIDLQSETNSDLWNAAWALAKASEFETDCVTDDERSYGRNGR